jgi:hypothetical protein
MTLLQWLVIGFLVFVISVTFTLGFLNLSHPIYQESEDPYIHKQSYLLI